MEGCRSKRGYTFLCRKGNTLAQLDFVPCTLFPVKLYFPAECIMLTPRKRTYLGGVSRIKTSKAALQYRAFLPIVLLLVLAALPLAAQTPAAPPGFDSLARPSAGSSPLTHPTLSPAVLLRLQLEGRISHAQAAGGGKAFATWFPDDAVPLNNAPPAVLGRANIPPHTHSNPNHYQLPSNPHH